MTTTFPVTLRWTIHPGCKNEYYFDHYNDDGADNLTTVNNNDLGDLGHNDGYSGLDQDDSSNSHDEPSPSDDVSTTNTWVTADGTNFAELCYQLKTNTLKLRNPVEQLSDLRRLALYDIYLFDKTQATSVTKDWTIDTHRQAMATISTFDPEKPLNSTRWCVDFSLTKYDDWMTPLGIAATYLVEAISSNNMIDIHTMQSNGAAAASLYCRST